MDVLDTTAPLRPVDAATMRAMISRDYNMRDTDEPCRACDHNVNAKRFRRKNWMTNSWRGLGK
jgi:hypothetical protein